MENVFDRLTGIQKAAIEGEVAYLLSHARTTANLKFRIYSIFKTSPEKYDDFYFECIKRFVDIPLVDLKRLLYEARAGEVPIWLWIDLCIADIKEGLRLSKYNIHDVPELNNANLEKYILKSGFASMCINIIREGFPELIIDLCNKVEEDFELDFLTDVCFIIKGLAVEAIEFKPKKGRKKKKKITDKILAKFEFSKKTLLSFENEMDTIQKIIDGEEGIKALREALNLEKKSGKGTKFTVCKAYKGSKIQCNLKTFDTLKEAVEFIKEIKKEAPELSETCTFYIAEM